MKLGMRRGCGLNPLRSWVAVCVFLAVVLLLCHDPLLIIWWPQRPAEKTKTEGLPLDMATDSIDDMYDGCRSEAAAMIDLFGVFEWHFNRDFSFSWALAEEGAKKPRHKFLKEEHAINSGESGLKGQVPLDLAPNAVDDMYTGCKDKMDNRVKKQYLPNEKNKDKNFTLAWGEAERYYNKKWKRRKGKRPSTSLGKEQIMAIYVYTLDKPNVYLDFNTAVRTKRSVYVTAFKYHTLHFFLTDALQTLSSRKPEGERCVTGYRRVNSSFRQDVLNKEIRFGSFTSSSMGDYPRPDRFGNKSCFEIFTCFGADISLYSKVGESEREVLIPPYEVFKVTKVERRSDHQSLPCEVVYKVKSTRTLSKLNCALF
ncbi:hypothetical protein INR49_015413 [Caranx melampygus]|nr:hypothetical protein INR49_015413 [Caranx melampygus]